ncbi:hypothetical protein LBMAG33_1940 [Candidatus Levyibacteriota bacterium]|nr:hypothetical protein LBMAG33_1940 [Candidatus Levybacteria bacterium]
MNLYIKRPIAIEISPNTAFDDVRIAWGIFFTPWRYINGNSVMLLEQWFRQYFSVSSAISFVSGRGALFIILQALGVNKDDEVIIQSFTCAVVPNAIIARGAKPIYVDINLSLTMDPDKLEKEITKKTKAIIVQHTFGIPSDIEKIVSIANKYEIPIIEDSAHVIGGIWKNKKLGSIGKVGFFSFGRDKAFSSVFGGMVITNDIMFGKKIRSLHRVQKNPSFLWILQQLFHPIAFYIILPLYDTLYIGKVILIILQKLHFLSFSVTNKEKDGGFEKIFLSKLPNALAILALHQVRKIKEYNAKRNSITELYIKELSDPMFSFPWRVSSSLLRFPVLINGNRDDLMLFMKKHNIYLGNWYTECIGPSGTDFEKIYYQRSNFPISLMISQKIINLPTYPTMKIADAKRIIQVLQIYARNKRS